MNRMPALLLLLTLPALAAGDPPAPGAPRCIPADDVSNAQVVDDRTILFHMTGGKIWKNTLPEPCHGLGFEQGIGYDINGGFICGNQQVIRVLRRGTLCVLGPFEPYEPPKNSDPGHSP